MKTIEEAAKEISDKFKNSGRIYSNPESAIRDGFKAGVEFAQRWYSVEEVKPTNREVVLAKVPFINYTLLFSYNEITSKWYQFDEGDFYESEINPTHWRPIELK